MKEKKIYTKEDIKELQAIINRYYAEERKKILNGDGSHGTHISMRIETREMLDVIAKRLDFTRQETLLYLLEKYTKRMIGESIDDLVVRQFKEGVENIDRKELKRALASYCKKRSLREQRDKPRDKAMPIAVRPSIKNKLFHLSYRTKKPTTVLIEEMITEEYNTMKLKP